MNTLRIYFFFNEIKSLAKINNTICCSISGSGPSIFTLVNTNEEAQRLKLLFDKVYKSKNLELNSYITSLRSKAKKCSGEKK